jgi:hypothetical protein
MKICTSQTNTFGPGLVFNISLVLFALKAVFSRLSRTATSRVDGGIVTSSRPSPQNVALVRPGNTKGGSINVPLTSCFTGLDWTVLQIKTKIVSCHTAASKPVKQEVNGTVILSVLVFPGQTFSTFP